MSPSLGPIPLRSHLFQKSPFPLYAGDQGIGPSPEPRAPSQSQEEGSGKWEVGSGSEVYICNLLDMLFANC